jgi:hypothetical protein
MKPVLISHMGTVEVPCLNHADAQKPFVEALIPFQSGGNNIVLFTVIRLVDSTHVLFVLIELRLGNSKLGFLFLAVLLLAAHWLNALVVAGHIHRLVVTHRPSQWHPEGTPTHPKTKCPTTEHLNKKRPNSKTPQAQNVPSLKMSEPQNVPTLKHASYKTS